MIKIKFDSTINIKTALSGEYHKLFGRYPTDADDIQFLTTILNYTTIRSSIYTKLTITAPIYFWNALDQHYGFNFAAKNLNEVVLDKPFEWGDFSHEDLMNFGGSADAYLTRDDACYMHAKMMGYLIESLNGARERYLNFRSRGEAYAQRTEMALRQIMQLLPSSYMQTKIGFINYETLFCFYRDEHIDTDGISELQEFRESIKTLKYAELILNQ